MTNTDQAPGPTAAKLLPARPAAQATATRNGWRQRVDVKTVLASFDEDAWDDDTPRLANAIADMLEPLAVFSSILTALRATRNLDELNICLHGMYDIADRERIWLGSPAGAP